MENKAVTIIRGARQTALKNREAALAKAARPFDDEIAAYDTALRGLLGTAPKAVVMKKSTAKKSPAKKKASPKKAVTQKKTAKKAPPAKKAVAAKKAAPPKKNAPKKQTPSVKKPVAPHVPGSYPKVGTVAEKLVFVIGDTKRFLSIQEVADHVKKHEPSQDVAAIKRRFSKHIDKFRGQGKIVSYAAEGKTYYGLPSYFKDGKALTGREHKS